MMDLAAVQRYRGLSVTGNGRRPPSPPNLTVEELAAFEVCATDNLRIEQERLPLWI